MLRRAPWQSFVPALLAAVLALPGRAQQPATVALPAPEACDRVLPINLPTALKLTNARAIDIAIAGQRVQAAAAAAGLAGAEDAARKAEERRRRTERRAAPGIEVIAPVEVVRARTELARRRQAVHAARERWRVASADLVRVLRLDPAVVVQPMEPPHL